MIPDKADDLLSLNSVDVFALFIFQLFNRFTVVWQFHRDKFELKGTQYDHVMILVLLTQLYTRSYKSRGYTHCTSGYL